MLIINSTRENPLLDGFVFALGIFMFVPSHFKAMNNHPSVLPDHMPPTDRRFTGRA